MLSKKWLKERLFFFYTFTKLYSKFKNTPHHRILNSLQNIYLGVDAVAQGLSYHLAGLFSILECSMVEVPKLHFQSSSLLTCLGSCHMAQVLEFLAQMSLWLLASAWPQPWLLWEWTNRWKHSISPFHSPSLSFSLPLSFCLSKTKTPKYIFDYLTDSENENTKLGHFLQFKIRKLVTATSIFVVHQWKTELNMKGTKFLCGACILGKTLRPVIDNLKNTWPMS